MDEQGFKKHREALREIALMLHRATTVIVIITFAGYGLSAWMFFAFDRLYALITATVFYIFFRLFRKISLMWVRRGVNTRPELKPAMQWLDAEIAERKASVVIAELDARLFTKQQDESA
jgi:hypothetical protein